jgi:hypothetical protein
MPSVMLGYIGPRVFKDGLDGSDAAIPYLNHHGRQVLRPVLPQ